MAVEQDKSLAQIFYVDHGWTAWVRIATLRCLDEQFCDLPQQVVVVKLSGIREMKGGNKWSGKAGTELSRLVKQGRGRGWVQRRKGGLGIVVDLFMRLSSINGKAWGPGKMTLVSQVLVEKGFEVREEGHRQGELDRSTMWEGIPVGSKCGQYDNALKMLVLASLVRVRVGERAWL